MTRKEIENAVKQALACSDKDYQLVEVCRTVAEVERERCAKIAESEEELNGPMPDENWVMAQRVRLEDHLRATVRVTKENIARRIRGSAGE